MEEPKKPEAKPVATLVQKIHAVMTEMKSVQKRGVNTNQNYKFAKETDFVDQVKPLLIKHRLIMLPSMQNVDVKVSGGDKPSFMTTVDMIFNLICIDSGNGVPVRIAGQGADRGDKGIYKAMTGAKKYAYSLAFHISTGDDPEDPTSEKDGKPKSAKVPDTKRPPIRRSAVKF